LSFEKYGLSPELLSGLADVRIEKPTPLQEKMLPIVLEGKHVLAEMHSNDDLAFLIPALQKITENGEVNGTQVLVLTPSIERAERIDEQIWALGYHAQIGSALMAMKGDKAAQEQALVDGAPVIVANPGRCIEMLEKSNFRLKDLKLIVIDEAHEMQQFNLVNRVKDILRFVDCEPQIVVLAQQQNNATEQLVKLALRNPELIGFEMEVREPSEVEPVEEAEPDVEVDLKIAEEKLDKASISVVLKKDIELKEEPSNEAGIHPESSDQAFIRVPSRMKISTLMAHLEQSASKRVIVFTASSRTSDRLFRIIRKKSWGVVSLGDDLDETMYNERLERFKKYEMRVLLIGGLSANKIELDGFEEFINYDVPNEPEEYQYRARMVVDGKVRKMISLVSKMDQESIQSIAEEAGFIPVELPLPEDLSEKRKEGSRGKSGKQSKQKPKSRSPKKEGNRSKAKKKPKNKTLPRPTYDGLSGGREGNDTQSSGMFGWVKKLFR